jgi:chitinase
LRQAIILLLYCLLPFSTAAQASIDPSLSSCPVSCQNVTSGWTHYHDIQDLQACQQPIIFDFNIYNTVDDSASRVVFRACSSSSSAIKQVSQKRQQLSFDTDPKDVADSFVTQSESRHLDYLRWAVDTTAHPSGNFSSITNALLDYLELEDQHPTGEPTILFARSGSAIIGAYAGAQIAKSSFRDIIQEFGQKFEREANDIAIQSCQENSTSTKLIGLFATTTGDLTKVQEAVRGWNEAKCITSASNKSVRKDFSVGVIPGFRISISPDNKDGQINARNTCKYTQVQPGDGCWALAQRCAISQDNLKKYNRPGVCTSPIVGEYVCCSAGTVPDLSPRPNPDGSCKAYSIKKNDVCSTIASKNSITVNMINDRNKMTWGWLGCSSLVIGASICVSTGSPPMPAAMQNAICGPQVPGTLKPSDMSHIEKLNPCPLNACCNIWGQCGITKDFCVQSPSGTGAPGTAKTGSNGCISSCGTNIINNAEKVTSFMKIGYFEAWNIGRKCLHMRVSHLFDGNLPRNQLIPRLPSHIKLTLCTIPMS